MIQEKEQIRELGIVPVITLDHAENATALGTALIEGNLPCAEITFRTEAAEDAIRHMATSHPDILLGAGTVLSVEQAKRAVGAGARFIVSPGIDPRVVTWCLEKGVLVVPGVATPTDITRAVELGLDLVKFFPAKALGGISMLKAVSAPFGHVRFIPTGGINASHLSDYLKLKNVHACRGSWLAPRSMIMAGDYEGIKELAKEGRKIVVEARAEGGIL